ncbi:ATP-grasp domain-containing protein [Staphylococcus simulans]|uniref:ATP-grasp domain-containing protein n=1 Tax=Staphylococcus simulans TaxID=1286 RepID=UPI00399AC47E
MKKVFILGASALQVPLIKTAKDMGLYVIIIDMNPDAVGFKYADEKYIVSTTDTDKIMKLALQIKPDAILTAATDMPMRTIAKVGEQLGYNTISYDTSLKATDKYLMRNALKEAGVPVPKFILVTDKSEYDLAINKITGPKIIKPIDSSGSRGIFLLNNELENDDAFNHAMNHSRDKKILVEECMIGKEVSVETMTINSKTSVVAITDKLTSGAPHFIETGHHIPSLLDSNIQKKIRKITIDAIQAIGIKNGPAHTEIIVTETGPKIVEIGARLGGDFITSHLVKNGTSIDLIKQHILQSLGELKSLENKIEYYGAAIRYFQVTPGIVQSIEIPEEITKNNNVLELEFNYSVGDKVEKIKSSSERFGYIICKGKTVKKAIELCDSYVDMINIITKKV